MSIKLIGISFVLLPRDGAAQSLSFTWAPPRNFGASAFRNRLWTFLPYFPKKNTLNQSQNRNLMAYCFALLSKLVTIFLFSLLYALYFMKSEIT